MLRTFEWNSMSREEKRASLLRPSLGAEPVRESVNEILRRVRAEGDKALRELTLELDGYFPHELEIRVPGAGTVKLDPDLKKAIDLAAKNISRFHKSQCEKEKAVMIMPGVKAWRKSVPVTRVGLYIPGGTAPLFSTVLMLGIPARLAGCREVVIFTPPGKDGSIHPAILYAAAKAGVRKIVRCGGAQAVAAMAYGTETIRPCDKIFGPGNRYVTLAKQRVLSEGIAVDMPAGPSEVAVLADTSANASFVAADLLSQAEHGPDSQVILVTDNRRFAEQVNRELEAQLKNLPRASTARRSLAESRAILVRSMREGMNWINDYAPEHLILACRKAKMYASGVCNAGSVFIGNYSCESLGDYATGPNHTLPTNGYARAWSGVSVDSFVKKITFQEVSQAGLVRLGPSVITMARAEGLEAHAEAVRIRLKGSKKEMK
ncbi:MAG: histidinol dehydrogenase [Bacteroidia bacterium]|nr:histidinol dehydrogenase [Bacteroidia bacterium]